MTTIKSQRLRSLIVHLDDRHVIYPPPNVGARAAMLAKQQGYIEIEGDTKAAAFKMEPHAKRVKARADINRPLKS